MLLRKAKYAIFKFKRMPFQICHFHCRRASSNLFTSIYTTLEWFFLSDQEYLIKNQHFNKRIQIHDLDHL
jgi:hypothetical protein